MKKVRKQSQENSYYQQHKKSTTSSTAVTSRVCVLKEIRNRSMRSIDSTDRSRSTESLHRKTTEPLSRSPSPSKIVILKQIQQNPYFACNIHNNLLREGRQRYLRYICCDPYCDTHYLCEQCLQDSLCPHEFKMKIEEFFKEPVLAYLKDVHPSQKSIYCEVVAQQTILFNKIKQQSENQKQVLKKYLDSICQKVEDAAKSVMEQYERTVEDQLCQMRREMDKIQEVCNIYKNHFENITLNILEEIESPEDLVSRLKQGIQDYFTQSDDPQDQLIEHIQILQKNLGKMPILNTTNMKNVYIHMTEADMITYKTFISE